MSEVLQLNAEVLAGDTRARKAVQKAYWAHIAGALDVWAVMIEDNPEMIPSITRDMKDLSKNIKKLTGVTIDIDFQ